MSIFSSILNKIFHHSSEPASGQTTPAGDTATLAPPSTQTAAPQNVDVGAVLSEMASMKDGGGNYQTSIVVRARATCPKDF